MKQKHKQLSESDSKTSGTSDINQKLLKEDYDRHIKLYQRYLDLLIKFSIFNFAVTGAILSFYFSHITNGIVRWSLVLPCIMQFFFGWITLMAYRSIRRINGELTFVANLFAFTRPGINTLEHALLSWFILLVVMIFGLLIVITQHNYLAAKSLEKNVTVEQTQKPSLP